MIIDICNFLSISTSIVEVHLKLEVNRRTGVAPIGRIYMHHRADGFTRDVLQLSSRAEGRGSWSEI